MCTRNIIESTTAGAVAGSVVPIVGTIAGAGIGATIGVGKEIKNLTKVPKPVTPPPPEDLEGKRRREAFRLFQRNLAGSPGPGRAATIFSQGTGTGPAGLKTKTGQ